MTSSQLVWSIEELVVTLPDGTSPVEPCDIHLERGELLHISGPSGCGKTQLLRALCVPTELARRGAMSRCERRWRANNLRVIYCPQGAPLFDWLGPSEQTSPMFSHEEPPNGASWPRHVHALSGGQQRQVAWHRALSLDPDVLVLDEPASGLDPEALELLACRIRGFLDEGGSVILVTHQRALVEAIGARVQTLELTPVTREANASRTMRSRACALFSRASAMGLMPGLELPLRWQLKLWWALGCACVHPRFLLFFGVTGLLLGASTSLVIAQLGVTMVEPQVILDLVAWRGLQWTGPVLAAILAAATMGASSVSWCGQQDLRGIPEAMMGLGARPDRALYAPLFWGTFLAGAMGSCVLLASVALGIREVAVAMGLQPPTWQALAALLIAPHTLARIMLYPLILSIVGTWHATAPRAKAGDVTAGMLGVTMTTSLFVVGLECIGAIRL